MTYNIRNRQDLLVDTFHKAGFEVWNHLQEHREHMMLTPLPDICEKVEWWQIRVDVLNILCRKSLLRFVRLLAKTYRAVRQ
jgi:hypothetical protein